MLIAPRFGYTALAALSATMVLAGCVRRDDELMHSVARRFAHAGSPSAAGGSNPPQGAGASPGTNSPVAAGSGTADANSATTAATTAAASSAANPSGSDAPTPAPDGGPARPGAPTVKGAAPDSESASSAAQLEAAGASAAAGSAAVIAADQRGNDAISARIRSRIDADPSLKDNSIAIETEDGTVRLSGSVPTNAARRRAADLALTVRGVVTVVDNVSVRRTA